MSTLSGYGNMKLRRLEIADQIIGHGTADNDYEVTLAFPNVASDVQISLPSVSSNATLLTDADNIDGDKVDIDSVANTVTSVADADAFLIHDNSNAETRKVTASDLKNYIQHTHSSSLSGGIEVGDGSGSFVERQLSGGATVDASGVVSITKDVTTDGTAEASANVVLDASRGVANMGAIDGDGLISTSDNVRGAEMEIGGANSWKLRVNSGNLELLKYDGAAYQVHQVFT